MKISSNIISENEKMKILNWTTEMLIANNAINLSLGMSFSFSHKMFSCFGLAVLDHRAVKISLPLWIRAKEDQKEWLVKHEVAHIIAHHRFGPSIKPHGKEWKMMMKNGKMKPDPYHDVDCSGLDRKNVAKFCEDVRRENGRLGKRTETDHLFIA